MALGAQKALSARNRTELGMLGSGGAKDSLHWRLVLSLMTRCLPLLRDVWKPLTVIILVGGVVAIVVLYPTVQLYDAFYSKILTGDPLTDQQARLLFMDPAIVTNAETFTPEVRQIALRRLCWEILGLVVFGWSIGLAMAWWRIWILQKLNQILRLELFDKFQGFSMRFHANSRVGDSIYRIYQDSSMVTQMIDVFFVTPIPAVFGFLFTMALVTVWSPILALTLIVLWLPLFLAANWWSGPLRVAFRRAREANSSLTSSIQEILSGIKVIKAYGVEKAMQGRFENDSLKAFRAAFQARNRFAFYNVVIFWLSGLIFLFAIWYGAKLTVEGAALSGAGVAALMGLSVWNLGLFIQFRERYGGGIGSSRGLMGLWGRTQDIAIGLDRVFEVLDTHSEIQESPDAVAMSPVKQAVVFRDVTFRYHPEGLPALDHVNLEAKSGMVTAFVGPTGSGKTTLISLLLRLYEIDEGSIEIDGTDIRKFRRASLPANIAVALQENVLFGDTIRENIRYAVPTATDAQVRAAARVACADEFIEKLPQGYDTPLGERGTKLSTGQRQRLSIARAILMDTSVLILDEPTASLDAETELKILQNLTAWGKDRVILLITHRLSTTRNAGQIIYMQEGKIVDRMDFSGS